MAWPGERLGVREERRAELSCTRGTRPCLSSQHAALQRLLMVDKCSKPSANGGEQVFVALVLGGSSNQLPGDVITLAQERVQKRGGRGRGEFDCSWQGMREKTSPERFFSVTEVCMAACKEASVCRATSLVVLCRACVQWDGEAGECQRAGARP